MPIYHFNLRGAGLIADPVGSDFASDRKALAEARDTARNLMPVMSEEERRRWWIEVRDESGRIVVGVRFADCMPPDETRAMVVLGPSGARH